MAEPEAKPIVRSRSTPNITWRDVDIRGGVDVATFFFKLMDGGFGADDFFVGRLVPWKVSQGTRRGRPSLLWE
ncbi:MAG: hypothetical protein ACYDG4_01330 [Desulfuromonadaceae bacterium]